MSLKRKNWTALSSLARQRTLEDEEEQARERRRRDRNLSSTTEAEVEALCPAQNANQPALERLCSLDETELPAAAMAEEEAEQKLTMVLRPQEARRQRKSSGNLRHEEEPQENSREPETGVGSQEAALHQAPARDGKILAGEQCHRVAQASKSPTAERCPELAAEQKVLAGEQHRGSAGEEKELMAEKPQEGKEVTEGQPEGLPREQKNRSHQEVKVLSRAGSRTEQKLDIPATHPSSQQDTVRNPPRAQEEVGLPSTQGRPEGSSVTSPSPIQITYSSSFKRISPRTVSFRVISKKDKEENSFTRSASMRIPASCVKIEEKLEKYTSAVQRSEGVKLPVSVPRGLLPVSEGVASKRSIFEAPSRTDPAPVRKENLKLPGVVTSRINLWISRTQEPSKDGRAKNTGKADSATKQPDDSSTDTRL
uniref:Ladinin 1 n=1 Tax=Pelusios castaneus TaxID=367368 RepID=A0A8C8SBJ7_9SAUR